MSQNRSTARTRKRSEEGAVMLVVMLILLTATALAGVSLQATQYELRAAGFDRTAVQTQYVSEAAMATTIAWVDAASLDGQFLKQVGTYDSSPNPLDTTKFGEPALTPTNRKDANRTQWSQQARLTNVNLPPLTRPGSNNDPIGTFGPKSNYSPGTEDPLVTNAALSDYVVDLYDCQPLPVTGTAGSQINQTGSGVAQQIQYYCVMTARGRSYLFGSFTGKTKTWKNAAGDALVVNRFSMAHDSRGTLVSPPIVR